MANNWSSILGLHESKTRALGVLLCVYFLCRLIFQQFPVVKTAFIFPTGWIVQAFHGAGRFVDGQWFFDIHRTMFVLGESCSGTTFFSLLVAYICFRIRTKSTSSIWLLWAYPVSIVANAIRVQSSMFAHNTLTLISASDFSDQMHVATGTVTFLCSFLCFVYIIERPLGDTE